jgi:acetyl-CoA carboxylase beta subunit
MIDRPSEKEEEFFKRQEMDRLRKLARAKEDQLKEKEREDEKKRHWMKCPKCGMDLTEIEFRKIRVDKCFSCEGVYLDRGELELLLKTEDKNIMKKIAKVFAG